MSRSPLFSTYRQGENRVTSSVMAVLERLDIEVVQRLLSVASEESALNMLSFRNQSGTGSESLPDAVISASFRFLFEVKTERDSVRVEQIEGHLGQLGGSHDNELLFVLTPDPEEPLILTELADGRIRWFNFVSLDRAIEDLLLDDGEPLNEQSRFLLRELRRLFEEDGLMSWDDTVIVAARTAFGEYLDHAAYFCQPGRSFKSGLTHLGFYRKGQIEPLVARILHVEEVVMTRGQPGVVGQAVDRVLDAEARPEGESFKVFLLSAQDSPETERLEAPILNTTTTASGKPWAWTLGQRYTTLAKLRTNPQTTSELDALE